MFNALSNATLIALFLVALVAACWVILRLVLRVVRRYQKRRDLQIERKRGLTYR
jgi:hypothetical protein